MWIKTAWGGYWQDPRKLEEARILGTRWAREALEELAEAIRTGERPALIPQEHVCPSRR